MPANTLLAQRNIKWLWLTCLQQEYIYAAKHELAQKILNVWWLTTCSGDTYMSAKTYPAQE